MFTVTHKKGPHGIIVVITDTEILGKYFSEGNRQLDLRSAFYKGEELDIAKIEVILRSGSIVHLTGKQSIALGKRLGIIEDGDKILVVEDVPHAEIVRE